MIINSHQIVELTGFRVQWVTTKFQASKLDFTQLDKKILFDSDLMLEEAKFLLSNVGCKNPKQLVRAKMMLEKVILILKEIN